MSRFMSLSKNTQKNVRRMGGTSLLQTISLSILRLGVPMFVLLFSPGPAAADAAQLWTPQAAGEAVTTPLNEIHSWAGGDSHGVHLHRLDIPSRGLLWVEVADLAGAPSYPLLHGIVPVPAGGTSRTVVLERSPTHLRVRVDKPGTYFVPVSLQPAGGEATYRLEVAFLPLAVALASTTETSTDGSADPPVDEWDEDDVSLTTAPVAAPASAPAAHEVPFCGLADADDHGDSFACATHLPLGSPLSGELRRAGAPDFDVFSFVLSETAAVRLETRGDTDTRGRLFDALGRRVAEDDDGGQGSSFRLLRTLPPGRYFLRVEGFGGAEGAYVLESTHLR